jgi:hypothetical protein
MVDGISVAIAIAEGNVEHESKTGYEMLRE